MPNRVKRTKPKQAASPRSLDRYQREMHAILRNAAKMEQLGRYYVRRLRRLLASMEKAEKR